MKLATNRAVLGSLLLASASASAAVVSLSTADYADGLVSTSGSLIGALNATTAETVNTVDFAALGANAGTIALSGGVSVTVFGGTDTGVGANGTAGALTVGGTFSTVNNGNINFTGLTNGQQYEIQFVLSDDRGVLSPDLVGIWDNADGSGTAALTTGDITGDAQIVTGTFTAVGTTQDFYLDQQTAVGTFDGYVGALQLRAVPEPSSTALLGLGGLALIMRRRR